MVTQRSFPYQDAISRAIAYPISGSTSTPPDFLCGAWASRAEDGVRQDASHVILLLTDGVITDFDATQKYNPTADTYAAIYFEFSSPDPDRK